MNPPKESSGDLAHAATRGALGAIPFGGTAAVEIFNRIVAPPLERRRDEWRRRVGERLDALEQSGKVDVDSLHENDVFVTTLMHASHAAVRNHREEKLKALGNAVLNAALPEAIDEHLQQMFIHYVDEFTVWHIRILHLFNDPVAWFQIHEVQPPTSVVTGSLSKLVTSAYPELSNQHDFYELVCKDLSDRKLSGGGSNLHIQIGPDGMWRSHTTEIGKQFIKFISDLPAD
ncbi:hypothetical protein [Stieleria maiorica]|nr:hypothetical protein [Stieleria maiorica]